MTTKPQVVLKLGSRGEQNNWVSTSALIASTLLGSFIIEIPTALSKSGWTGMFLLVTCAFFANISANLLGQSLHFVEGLQDYGDVGEFAFGHIGRKIMTVSQYITICGLAGMNLLTLGDLLHSVNPFSCIPPQMYTLLAGVSSIFFVLYATHMSRAKWFTPISILATFVAMFIIFIISLSFRGSADYLHERAVNNFNTILIGKTYYSGFSVIFYIFNSHAIFPNIYAETQDKNTWWKSTNLAFNLVLLVICVPIAGACYITYGEFLSTGNNILETISSFAKYQTSSEAAIYLMCIHFYFTFPILVLPLMNKAERSVLGCKKQRKKHVLEEDDKTYEPTFMDRACIRIPFMIIVSLFTIFFPFFKEIVGLFLCFTIMCDVYLFPSALSWYLSPPKNIGKRVLLILVFAFGIVGCGFGVYGSALKIKHLRDTGAHPYTGMFTFDCKT